MIGDESHEYELDPTRVLEIIREENPAAVELAIRRAVIEQQREIIVRLAAAADTTSTNGELVT